MKNLGHMTLQKAINQADDDNALLFLAFPLEECESSVLKTKIKP